MSEFLISSFLFKSGEGVHNELGYSWYYKDGGCKVFVFAKKRSEQHILYSEIMENSKKL